MTHRGAVGRMALSREIRRREGADVQTLAGASSLTRQRGADDRIRPYFSIAFDDGYQWKAIVKES